MLESQPPPDGPLCCTEKEGYVRQSELFQVIEKFLASRNSKQQCDHCASPMQFLSGQFWLNKTVLRWDMALPFCPKCDMEMEAYSHRIHGIQANANAKTARSED